MAKRVTIQDIAKRIGVSTSSVTYALNGTPKISQELRNTVLETAQEMGYMPNRTAQALARNTINIGIIYPEEPIEFFDYIKRGIDKGLSELVDYKVKGIHIPIKDLNSANEMKNALGELYEQRVTGLILSPGFNFFEYKEIVNKMINKGIHVLYLINDLFEIGGIGCIRMNGRLAGRMASQFLGFCIGEGKNVGILCGNKQIKLHKECIDAFINETERNNLVIRGIYETQDDKNIAYYLTEKLLKEIPNLAGLYVSSYNSVSVCKCLEDHKKANDVFVIGQDLYPDLVKKLENGSLKATLFQDPIEQGRKAIRYMFRYLTEEKRQFGDVLITPQLVFTSNLEGYKSQY